MNSPSLSGCHPHFETLTRMKVSASFHPHYRRFTRITNVSPTFCNCQVKNILPPSSPRKKYMKKQKQSKLFLKRKRSLGKPILSTKPWTFNSMTSFNNMTSVYFHFLSLSPCISSLCIVYNRGTILALACSDTPSWWMDLVNENVACSICAYTGRKMKITRIGVQPFFRRTQSKKTTQ